MKTAIYELVKDKKVLILGFGREGISSYKMIDSVGGYACLDVADQKPLSVEICDCHKRIIGEEYLDHIDEYDVVMKSPGIVLPKDISEYTANITCQTDLFLKVFGSQTIGITGTKGKSTTSTLLYHVLKEAGFDVLLGGNIGIPIFDVTADIKADTIIVMELSCHQLEFNHYAPHRSIFLNLYEDHLDHYGTFEKYCAAKKHIYENQTSADFVYCNKDFLPSAGTCQSTIIPIDASLVGLTSWDEVPGAKLRGAHNFLNASFDYMVCKDLGVSREVFLSALATYNPLAHRLEFLGSKDGVDYYDDSISTTVESAISAMKAIDNAGIILLGGMDRGINYNELVDYLQICKLDDIILMYDSGLVIKEKLEATASSDVLDKVHYIKDLKDACDYAKAHAKKGKAVILSPAAASYGVFKNFEERGDKFKSYIFEE